MAEKGIDYTLEQVNPFAAPPEFLEISPLKRSPAFRDTDLPEPNTLSDSSVICDYLEHKKPSPSLYPSDAFQRARVRIKPDLPRGVVVTQHRDHEVRATRCLFWCLGRSRACIDQGLSRLRAAVPHRDLVACLEEI